MSVVTQIFSLLIVFIAALVGSILFILNVDPGIASLWQLVGFYALLFLTSFSATTLVGFSLRLAILKKSAWYSMMVSSRRQGVWFGLTLVAVLVLQSYSVFTVWTAGLLLLLFTLIELYAVSR